MVKRMLIEATHPEETRVVVLDGTRLEEFDVETSTKKQIKGNIYLAKVVRVEPSLQAAFVDYGGNRHGFLAFSEIHPDYYQIPVADRERLMAEVARQEEEEERRLAQRDARRRAQAEAAAARAAAGHSESEQPPAGEAAAGSEVGGEDSPPSVSSDVVTVTQEHHHDDHDHGHDHHHDHDHSHDHDHDHAHDHDHDHGHDGHDDHGDSIPLAFIPPAISAPVSDENDDDEHEDDHEDRHEAEASAHGDETAHDDAADLPPPEAPTEVGGDSQHHDSEGGSSEQSFAAPARREPAQTPANVDTVGGDEEEEAADEKQRRRFVAARHYKIQEVIKRRQIMLIQVVKEERGNKGAALTTYLSLAGRYCVLMPNSPRGGGVSRKITSAQDRRRLKAILGDLELPKNMAVILRTAGAERNKTEIKRDYEYLQRTWNNIREVTMTSRAPALIHEEASLIKRAIRDIYSRDIEEVWVEGEEGYKVGKDFMKMLTPSHAKKVQRYKDDIIPLFHRYQVESQMEAINSPTVQLRSGGSIVFAQTEALVAIDVNSGRATKERHIEETAYKTNCEAADEIARQLRLRDLAGLVVIDFIDMEDNRNNHSVERRLKEALKADRARIQVGRISHFGLLELSRQRLRPSLIEANFRVCAHCAGSGLVRSTESAAVYSLRMLEEEGGRQRSSEVTITVHPDVALYLLNYKREALASIESRYRIKVFVLGDATLVPPNIRLDRVKAVRNLAEEHAAEHAQREAPRVIESVVEAEVEEEEDEDENEETRESVHEQRPQGGQPREGGREGGRDGGREGGREGGGRKRRRRRRRGGADRQEGGGFAPREGTPPQGNEPAVTSENAQPSSWQDGGDSADEQGREREHHAGGEPDQGGQPREEGKRGRRRGRRGGRRRRRGGENGQPEGAPQQGGFEGNGGNGGGEPVWNAAPQAEPRSENEPPAYVAAAAQAVASAPVSEATPNGNGESGPSRFFRAIKETWRRGDGADGAAEAPAEAAPPAPAPVVTPPPAANEPPQPSKKGWWNKDAKE